MLDTYLMQRFIIRWRVWLTHRLTGDWLDGDAYYRGRFVDDPIDNPDQRIQQDIDIFTTGTGPETNTPTSERPRHWCSARSSPSSTWSRSPRFCGAWRARCTIFGVTVPKALFWMALLYVFFTTVVAFWIGRPLIRLSFRNELTNAAFRYALVRLRDAGEAIGLYRGERAERGQLMTRFAAVIANYRAFVRRGVAFLGWNRSMNQIVDPLPTVIQAPRMFAGQIQFGDLTQSSSAFVQVQSSLSFFRSVYDAFASYRAAIIRLDGLVDANETARELPSLTALPSSRRFTSARQRRGADACGDTSRRSARRAARSWRVVGDHRYIGQRQNHPSAQPGAAVAVHVGHAAPPGGRHHVPVSTPVCAPG